MPNEIEKDIFRTIAYFAFFQYPVTQFEIYKWLMMPEKSYSFFDVCNSLEESVWLREKTDRYLGFYTIQNSAQLVAKRHEKFLNAIEKRKKLKKVINYLKRIPSIECIALCNSMPFHFTKPSSDIDLFIIASGGRLWSTRLSAVSPLIALKQRPGEAVKNPIDISFFISGKCLSIEELKIQENDLYLAVWVQSLVPLYENRAGIFDLFLEKNIWAKKMLPNSENNRPGKLEVRPIIQLPIGFSEEFAQWVQEKRLPERIKMLANQGTEVVVNADMLKFHLNDRRQEILQFIEKEICKSES